MNFITIILLVIDDFKKYNYNFDSYSVLIIIFIIFEIICIIFCDKYFLNIFGNTILVIYSICFDNYFKYWIISLSIFICCISINDLAIQIRIHLTENTDQIFPSQTIIITNVHISNPVDCCICLDYINQNNSGKLQKCGHIFHKDCIEQWFIVDPNLRCPMCRDTQVT